MISPRARSEMLQAEAVAIRALHADILDATDIGTYAVAYAVKNWAVLPLRGKYPAIKGGRGVLDATSDIHTVVTWWSGRYAGCNIGGRVPDSMIAIDLDPRHGGFESLAALQRRYGPLPETLTHITGRGDGGRHLFFRRPPGQLSASRLGPGIDLKTASGYVVLPPSLHPDTGKPYERIDAPVAAPPNWLGDLLCPAPGDATRARHSHSRGQSVADQFSAHASWADILTPYGWRCLDIGADADDARWLHPTHTSSCSATVRHGCLFVYSPNTPFDVTESGHPNGYTKFRAYAVLRHGGDMKAAARAFSGVV